MDAVKSDTEELRKYRNSSDEAAFERLVVQYLPLVFGTALRLVNGDAHMAQDIAQLVFLNLARKAGDMPKDVLLAGWLHRDTRYTALEMLRKERRRRAREESAEVFRVMDHEQNSAGWPEVAPVLDDALNSLPHSDRDALLLRFLQNLSVREVGARLGIGESGASRRIQGALENLRRILRRKGAAVSASGLATLLSTRSVEALPASVLPSVLEALRPAFLGAGAAAPASGLFLLMTTKLNLVLAGIALGALLIGGLAWKISDHPEEEGSRSLEQSESAAEPSRPPERLASMQQSAAVAATSEPGQDPRLARLRAVLFAAGRTGNSANPELKEALDELWPNRKPAIPLLIEALRNGSGEVRRRALAGLQILNGDAQSAVPELIEHLRQTTDQTEAILAASALESMGHNPDIIPALAEAMRENPAARMHIANAISSLVAPGSPEAARAADFFRPLINDPDAALGAAAAGILAALKDTSDSRLVLGAALEGLRSTNDDDQVIAFTTLSNLGAYSTNALPQLRAYLLGTHRPDLKLGVVKLLNELDPAFSKERSSPEFQKQQEEQAALLGRRIQEGSATAGELVQALADVPEAIPAAAKALAAIGFERLSLNDPHNYKHAILALSTLARTASTSEARWASARAYSGLQPMRPRLVYSAEELHQAFQALQAGIERLPETKRPQAQGLLNWTMDLQARTGHPGEFSSDIMLTLAKGLEKSLGTIFMAEMRRVDPNFR